MKIHATKESVKLGYPLFTTNEARDIVLQEVASKTDSFTPRYIADIATIAKSFLIDRIAKEKGVRIGLTEEDLRGHTMTVDDWERAFIEVNAKYDSAGVRKRDEELKRFVQKTKRGVLGFGMPGGEQRHVFSQDVYNRVAMMEANREQNETTKDEE